MTCWIDHPNLEKSYIQKCYRLMPDIKTSKYCEKCLAEHTEEIEPIDCMVSIERDKHPRLYKWGYFWMIPSFIIVTQIFQVDLLLISHAHWHLGGEPCRY